MNVKPIIVFFFIFSWLLVVGIFDTIDAQNQYFSKTYTTENGLPFNSVQDIKMDHTGFLWIATWNGLSRYDGHEFKNYYHQPDDSTSFPFFVTDKILVDPQNTVWICVQNRPLTFYNRATDNFSRFRIRGKLYPISDLALGQKNDLWLINPDSLFHYNLENHSVLSYEMADRADNQKFNFNFTPQIVVDNMGGLWVFGFLRDQYLVFKLTVIDHSIAQLQKIKSLDLKDFKSLSLHNAWGHFDIYVSEIGNTWLFCKYGLYQLNTLGNEFVKTNEPINPYDFSGKPYFTWCDDTSGIHVIDTRQHTSFSIDPPFQSYLECVFIDPNNRIWSGNINKTMDNMGLIRNIQVPGFFKNYLTKDNDLDKNNLIFSILKDRKNQIWAAARGVDFVYRIDPEGSIHKSKLNDQMMGKKLPQVRSMVQDSEGIWFGCQDNLLCHYDFQTGKYAHRQFNSTTHLEDAFNLGIHNLLKRNNDLLINGEKGVYQYDPKKDSLTLEYTYGPTVPVFCMIGDPKNGYWLGTNSNSIIHLSPELKEISRYRIGDGFNNIENICLGDHNDVWIAIMGDGLGHLDLNSGKSEVFTTADGLSNNTTYSILKDRKGNLWISTDLGISRFIPSTRKFRNFTKNDGLKVMEFNSDAAFKASDGQMFFGGVGGMVSFYPDSITDQEESTILPTLAITDFKVSGMNRFFHKAIYDLDSIVLNKGDNNFQLTFASLDFQNADKIRYRYRLIGESNDWIETDHLHRNLNFTNIKPGDYKLEIESSGLNGNWDNTKSMMILIPSFYYETWWFKTMIYAIGLTFIFGFIFMYIHQMELKAKQKQDQLKLESLGSQMNPHFIFNSLNSINYFISKNDKLSANHYIADFSRLIRSILSNMSKDYIPIEKELESIQDYLELEHVRFSDKFNYELIADTIELPSAICVAPGMIQPFIENAIWHGVRSLEDRMGFLKIELIQTPSGGIKCIIEDDGIGRKQSELNKNSAPKKKSYGIEITRERMKIINQLRHANYQIRIEDLYPEQIETGTKVSIDLPEK